METLVLPDVAEEENDPLRSQSQLAPRPFLGDGPAKEVVDGMGDVADVGAGPESQQVPLDGIGLHDEGVHRRERVAREGDVEWTSFVRENVVANGEDFGGRAP